MEEKSFLISLFILVKVLSTMSRSSFALSCSEPDCLSATSFASTSFVTSFVSSSFAPTFALLRCTSLRLLLFVTCKLPPLLLPRVPQEACYPSVSFFSVSSSGTSSLGITCVGGIYYLRGISVPRSVI